MRRRRVLGGVGEAIERLGGPVKAAALGNTTPTTVYKWARDGYVRLAGAALLWAAALEPNDAEAQIALARRLAGLD